MSKIEGNRESRHAIRRKPFFGKPDVRFEFKRSRLELPIELLNSLVQLSSADSQRKIAEAKFEQLPVGHAIQSKCHESIVESSPGNFVKALSTSFFCLLIL